MPLNTFSLKFLQYIIHTVLAEYKLNTTEYFIAKETHYKQTCHKKESNYPSITDTNLFLFRDMGTEMGPKFNLK